MDNITEWLVEHWPELAAALGVGGGGGLIGKKLTDSTQDKKIKEMETILNLHDKKISKMALDIDINSRFDEQFREQVDKDRTQILETLKEIKASQSQMIDHLLSKSK